MENDNLNILITSVGRRSYLVQYFKEALKDKGKVHVSNSDSLSPAFLIADCSVVTPLIYDEKYIDFILNYCLENRIKAVISLFDIDLPILAKNKEKFIDNGIELLVSDKRVIDICNDKYRTYQFLLHNNFKTPKTYLKIEDVLKDIKQGLIDYPFIIKPRWGMGSIGVNIAKDEEELIFYYKKTKETIFHSYLEYESNVNIEECVLIQEKIIGQEYGLDVINDLNGNYQNTIVKMKYAMRAGETDCAITINNNKIKEIGYKLSQSLKHIVNLDVDVFVDNENIYVLEMNARFGGGYPFSHASGVDLPQAIVEWLQGNVIQHDLLEEKFDIMYQKDIILVPISNGKREG